MSDDFLQLHGIAGQSELISITTAIYNIGCFLGAIAAAVYGDHLGRKRTIIIGTTIMAIGAALQTTSYSLAQMIVGRVIAGIGNGLNTSTAPVWQADSAKSSWRGFLVVVECVMNIVGFCAVNWISACPLLHQSWAPANADDNRLWYVFCWRQRSMESTVGHPIHLHLHTVCDGSLATRITKVSASTRNATNKRMRLIPHNLDGS